VPYLSASAVVIHYEEALYQVYAPYLTLPYLTLPYVQSQLLRNSGEILKEEGAEPRSRSQKLLSA